MAQKIIAADGSVYVKKKPFYLRWWFITLVILVLLGGCASMMGGSKSSTKVSAPSSPAAANSAATSDSATVDSSAAESNAKQSDSVPSEYKSALKKAESYSRTMHMSKQGIYNQLTSEFEQFTPEAAQYAVDNMKADWNANAWKSKELPEDDEHVS